MFSKLGYQIVCDIIVETSSLCKDLNVKLSNQVYIKIKFSNIQECLKDKHREI